MLGFSCASCCFDSIIKLSVLHMAYEPSCTPTQSHGRFEEDFFFSEKGEGGGGGGGFHLFICLYSNLFAFVITIN